MAYLLKINGRITPEQKKFASKVFLLIAIFTISKSVGYVITLEFKQRVNGRKSMTKLSDNRDSRKKCPWLRCGHGWGVAAYGSCYVAGDPDDPLCSKFISEEEWENSVKQPCQRT